MRPHINGMLIVALIVSATIVYSSVKHHEKNTRTSPRTSTGTATRIRTIPILGLAVTSTVVFVCTSTSTAADAPHILRLSF